MQGENDNKLAKFVDNINGKEGTSSHLVSVPRGPPLSEALVNSTVVAGEDGQPAVAAPGIAAGVPFGYDFDPNEDPELALVRLLTAVCYDYNRRLSICEHL